MQDNLKIGSESVELPPIWPQFVLDEIAKNKGWRFQYNKSDPLFQPEDKFARYKVRPVHHTLNYILYKKGEASHWTAEETLDLSQDVIDWSSQRMLGGPQKYIKKILVYFLSADSGVGANALNKFCKMFPHWQINQFYLWQAFNESIHSETYAKALEAFVTDPLELEEAFDAIERDPGVSAKSQLLIKWIESEEYSPHENLVAFGFGESVGFSSSFSSIGWLKQYLGMMPGLTYSNDVISRDEGLHCTNTFVILRKLIDKLPAWRVYQIGCEFVEKEFLFISHTLEVDLIGMNSGLLKQYCMFVADITWRWMGYPPIYNVKNPFPWMDKWSVDGITSFFEKRNPEYQQPGVMQKVKRDKYDEETLHELNIDMDDF